MTKSQSNTKYLNGLFKELSTLVASQEHDSIQAWQDMFDETDAIGAAEAPVVAEFVSSPLSFETAVVPAAELNNLGTILADLDIEPEPEPDFDLDGAEFESDGAEQSAPVGSITPALRAIMEAKRDEALANSLRNGRGAQKNKARLRKKYADHIMATEGREVNCYEKDPTPERVREQGNARVKKFRANRTPEQVEADRKKNTEAKRLKREEEKERKAAEAAMAAAALKDQALF